jgi:hypothetical protein
MGEQLRNLGNVWDEETFTPKMTNGRASKNSLSQWESRINLPGEGE